MAIVGVKKSLRKGGFVADLNIRYSDLETVAHAVVERMGNHGGGWNVWACPNGDVYLENDVHIRYKHPKPDEWWVGYYKKDVEIGMLVEDLRDRLEQINPLLG